jgi:hypothetical protein
LLRHDFTLRVLIIVSRLIWAQPYYKGCIVKPWSTIDDFHGWWSTIVNHGSRKLSTKLFGLGSNPGHENFILYFFNIFCQAEAQNHLSTKFFGEIVDSFFYKIWDTFLVSSQYFAEIFKLGWFWAPARQNILKNKRTGGLEPGPNIWWNHAFSNHCSPMPLYNNFFYK